MHLGVIDPFIIFPQWGDSGCANCANVQSFGSYRLSRCILS